MPYKDKEKQKAFQRIWMEERRKTFFLDKVCVLCGSKSDLELDHIDPSEKENHRVWSWTEERRNKEVEKCQVLCHTCHNYKTMTYVQQLWGMGPREHGTRRMYDKARCRCTLCKRANATAKADWRNRTGKH